MKKNIKVNKSEFKFYSKVLKVQKIGNKVSVFFFMYFQSDCYKSVDISNSYFCLGDQVISSIKIGRIYPKQLSSKEKLKEMPRILYKVDITLAELFDKDRLTNSVMQIQLKIDGEKIKFPLSSISKDKNEKYRYVPFLSIRHGDAVCYFRRTYKYRITCVKRPVEQEEEVFAFKFFESKMISSLLVATSKIYRLFSRKNINLYFEKDAAKAEEGVFELFEKSLDPQNASKNYFIIKKTSADYQQIKDKPNVIVKFSPKYYLILYLANNIIATEAPLHVNILRTRNRVLKKNILQKKFIFLQHGIIYLKNMGKNVAFRKGKESECDYIVVSSEKEREVVKEMLEIPGSRIWVTGLMMFDKAKYNIISQKSDNNVVIMLTWKPYEEHLEDFEESSYYKNTIKIVEHLKKELDIKNIQIVPHPKVKEQLCKTSMSKHVYTGKISEVIANAKLLITDYSSICYYSFYQGSGVLFYHEDLEEYELYNGELIPRYDEYIGHRVFDENELTQKINQGITNGIINLAYFREDKYVKNYKKINAFYDGRNIERVYEKLIEHKLL